MPYNHMNTNSNYDKPPKKDIFLSKREKLQQIQAVYKESIKNMHQQAINSLELADVEDKKMANETKKSNVFKNDWVSGIHNTKLLQSPKSVSTYHFPESQYSSSKLINSGSQTEQKIRASIFLKGESVRTIEILRRQNETKELKIRQLGHKCQHLVQKLKKHLSRFEFQAEMETLRQFSDGKMQRLEHLFKIRQEEIFFKIKLQVIGLLQEFGVSKEDLSQFNQVSSESNLFNLMALRLKNRLKDFRSKQQESSFELQKDKIMGQKKEERIYYLTETNQLLKLSEAKLKGKVEELKNQLNQYLQRLNLRERQNEEIQNEVFRLKKTNQQLQNVNQKLHASNQTLIDQNSEEKKLWQVKQKQMKVLLNSYFIQKKKLEVDIAEKDGEIQQIIIKLKFMEQENERINRELVRWKQRYEILEIQRNQKASDLEEQNNALMKAFQEYKETYNQGILTSQKTQVDQALQKIQQYQRSYERVVLELEEQRRLLQKSEEQNQQRFLLEERQWLQRLKNLEKVKEEQLIEMSEDCQQRLTQIRDEFQKKQQLLAEEMQARLKALLAQKDKRATEQLIELQSQNDELKRQINNLNKVISVKESLINVINSKKIV